MATDNTHLTQSEDVAGSTAQEFNPEVVQVADANTGGATQPNGNATQPAPIPGVPNGEVQVQVPAGQTVVRVQVAPGETIDLPFDGGMAAKFGQQGNLAIKVGDQTIILLGYAEANQQSGVTVKDGHGHAVDVASVIAATDPNLDIQTAAGPAAGPGGQGGHLFFDFNPGHGLAGFGELNVIDPTQLQYGLIQPDEKILLVGEPEIVSITFDVTGGTVNEDDFHHSHQSEVITEALVIGGHENGVSQALQDQLGANSNFTNVTFGNYQNGNDPYDTDDHEAGSQNNPPLNDNNGGIDQDREPLSSVAHVAVNFHSNGKGTLTFDNKGDTPIIDNLIAQNLTSHGNALSYALLPATAGHGESIVAYYNTEGGQVVVFSLEIEQPNGATQSTFDIAFTIYGALDNPVQGTGLAGEDSFDLNTIFFVNAGNGNTIESGPNALVFHDIDDVPELGHYTYVNQPDGEGGPLVDTAVHYNPANLTLGLDESQGVQHTQYDRNTTAAGNIDPTGALGQQTSQHTDDIGGKHAGNIEQQVETTINTILNGDPSDPLIGYQQGVLANLDHSYLAGNSFSAKPMGAASEFVDVSFGADGKAEDNSDGSKDTHSGKTLFAHDGDAVATAFQLYMQDPATATGGPDGSAGNNPIDSHLTNVTISVNDGHGNIIIEQVTAYQLDANTIIGIALPPVSGDGGDNQEITADAREEAISGGIPVFEIHIDPQTGELSMVQYHQVNNPAIDGVNGPNDPLDILTDDGQPLVHLRATDYDGDYVDAPLELSIIDDAPKVHLCVIDCANVMVDETLGVQTDHGADDQHGPVPSIFDGLSATPALSWAQSSGAIVSTAGTSYGVDGPGTTVMTLHTSTDGVDSGLTTDSGQHIFLYQDGDIVVGKVGDASGPVAFAVALDTSTDQMTVVQYIALHHNDATNPNDIMSIADSALQVTLTVTDVDGDSKSQTVSVGGAVEFRDDAPIAHDDYATLDETLPTWLDPDHNPHQVTGNVVLGNSNDLNPFNNSTPDHESVDHNHTITEMKYGDTTIDLDFSKTDNAAITTNHGLDATNISFNSLTGVLSFDTPFGHLDIVVDSKLADPDSTHIADYLNPAELGSYVYTGAHNAIDTYYGVPQNGDGSTALPNAGNDPDNITQLLSTFGNVQISNNMGDAWSYKEVTVDGKTYAGLGVAGGIDPGETDTNYGNAEQVTLKLPTPVHNATVTLGAFFDGDLYDNGHLEVAQWQALDIHGNVIASGVVTGDHNGLVDIHIETGQDFSSIVLTPLNDGAGNSGDNSDFLVVGVNTCQPVNVNEQFNYTLTDSDGDSSSANLNINVIDDKPSIALFGNTTAVIVDEDGLPGGTNNDTKAPDSDKSPGDLIGGHNSTSEASYHGGVFHYDVGADGFGSLTLNCNSNVQTIDGKNVIFAWDEATHQLIGYEDGDSSKIAIEVTLHPANGVDYSQGFTFDVDLKEPLNDPQNSVEDNLQLNIQVQIEDGDCDVATGNICVTVNDDMPVVVTLPHVDSTTSSDPNPQGAGVCLSESTQTVTVDTTHVPNWISITALNDAGTTSGTSLDTITNVGFGVVSNTDGGDGGRYDEVNYTGHSKGSESLVFNFGTQLVESATVELARFYSDENGTDETGHWVAFKNGNMVAQGDFVANSASGQFGFAIPTVAGGFDKLVFTATNDLQFTHGDNSDYLVQELNLNLLPTDQQTGHFTYMFGADGGVLPTGNANSEAGLGFQAHYTGAALNSDGHPVTVTESVVNGHIMITGTDSVTHLAVFSLDVNPGTPDANGLSTASYTYTQYGPLDNNPAGSNLPFHFAITDRDGDTVGTDVSVCLKDATPTAGAASADVYEKGLDLPGTAHDGTDAGDGKNIASGFLNFSYNGDGPGHITGITSSNGDGATVSHTGDIWTVSTSHYTLTVDDTTGYYTFTLTGAYANTNGTPDSFDNVLGHSGNTSGTDLLTALGFGYTVADADGSTANGTLNVSVHDDGPVVTACWDSDSRVVLETEDAKTIGGNSDSDTAHFGSLFDTNVNYGADGAGHSSVTYALTFLGNTHNGSDSGLTSDGHHIYLFNVGGTVYGTTSSNGQIDSSHVVFSLSVNGSGDVTLTQNQELDHPLPGSSSNYDAQTISLAGGLVGLTGTVTATDSDGDSASADKTLDLGGNVKFEDDGPSISISLSSDSGIVLLTHDAKTIGNPGFDTSTADFSGVFHVTSNYGADTPGSTSATSYALSFIGTTHNGSDSGLDSDGHSIFLYNNNGVITGSTSSSSNGVNSGNTVFTLTSDSSGHVTLTQFQEIDHPTPGSSSNYDGQTIALNSGLVGLTASATATDFDHDTASASQTVDLGGNVKFADDGPSISISLSSDSGIVLLTHDAKTIGNPGFDTSTADFSGVFHVTSNYGADTPGSTSATSYALSFIGTTHNGSDSGLDSDGHSIFLYNNNGVITGSTSSSSNGVNSGNTVFTLTSDSSGHVTLTQFQEIDHPTPGSSSNYDGQTIALNSGLVGLTASATATDFDHDTASASQTVDLGGNVKFADDGPSISISLSSDSGIVLLTHDAKTIGNPGFDTSTADFSGVFHVTSNYGADTPGSTSATSYALSFIGTTHNGSDSGLDSDGHSIFLYNNNGVITGSTSSSSNGVNSGNTVFTLTSDSSGHVTLTQFQEIDHPTPGSSSNYDGQTIALNSGLVGLTASATATDFDHDTASASQTVDLGGNVKFADDGPSISISLSSDSGIVLLTHDAKTIGNPGFDTSTADFSGVFHVTSNYGADTPGSTSATSYALSFIGTTHNGSDSGLDSDGHSIFLYNNNGVITGSTSSSSNGVNSGNTVFTLTSDSSGHVTLTQFQEIDHPTPGSSSNYDGQTIALNSGLVGLTASATATDFDHDTASASQTVDLGGNVKFADDGPSVTVTLSDATEPTLLTHDHATIGGGHETVTADFSSMFSITDSVGADAPGTVTTTYALSLLGSTTDSGLTSGGEHIMLSISGGVVSGITTGGETVFTISVDSNGTVSLTQDHAIDHLPSDDASSNYSNQILSLAGGLVGVTATTTATDYDGDTASGHQTVDLGGHVSFADDGPSGISAVGLTVDEDALTAAQGHLGSPGIEGGPNDIGIVGSVSVGSLAGINFGADGPGDIKIDTTTLPTLTSDGHNVQYSLSGDGHTLTGFIVYNSADNQLSETVNIFTLTIDPAGLTTTFSLLGPIDHPNPGFGSNTNVDIEDNSTLSFNYNATDGDGDHVPGTINVTVNDDSPTANCVSSAIIGEPGMGAGQTAVAYELDTSNYNNNDGNDHIKISAAFVDGSGNLTTINGDTPTINVNTDSGDGDTTTGFGVSSMGDHGDGGRYDEVNYLGDGSPSTLLSSEAIILSLADHSKVAVSATIDVSEFYSNEGGVGDERGAYMLFRDGVPVSGWVMFEANSSNGEQTLNITGPAGGFDEVRLIGVQGSANPNGDNGSDSSDYSVRDVTFNVIDAPHIVSASGDLSLAFGADGPGSVFLSNTGPTDLTFHGQTITNEIDNGILVGKSTDGTVVYTLNITHDSNGYHYEFDLSQPIDQLKSTDGSDVSRSLDFSYDVRDNDGDTVSACITVNLTNHGVTVTEPVVGIGADTVEEQGLSPDGSHAGDGSNTTTGFIAITAPDGVSTVVINGTPVDLAHPGTQVTTTDGILTVTGYDPSTGHLDYSYTLTTNTHGEGTTDTISVVVTDPQGDSSSSNLVISIVDDNPAAHDDTGSVTAGNVLQVAASGVEGNDVFGADGKDSAGGVVGVAAGQDIANPVSGSVGTTIAGTYGTLTLNADGSYTYTANPNVTGTDHFVYTIEDGDGDKSTAHLDITVNPAPVPAITSGVTADESLIPVDGGQPAGSHWVGGADTVTGSMAATLATDGLTVAAQTLSGNFGSLQVNADGTYTYTLTKADTTNPASDGANTIPAAESFTIQTTDSHGNHGTATITVDIKDDAPIANADDNPNPLVATGQAFGNVEANDVFGADGKSGNGVVGVTANGTTVSDGTGVGTNVVGSKGVLQLSSDGSYIYHVNAGATAGTDTFTYTIKDGDGDLSTTTLTLHVNNGVTVNEPAPNVAGHSQVLESGLQPDGTLHNGTSNVASDVITVHAPDGVQTIQIGTTVLSLADLTNLGTTHITVPGADGNLVLTGWNSSTGHLSYTYTLTHNTSGDTTSDSFQVIVTDPQGDTNPASNLVISIVDDVPHATNDDNATQVSDGNVLTSTVSVEANDTFGADGKAGGGVVGVIAGNNPAAQSTGVGTDITGSKGVLHLNADGSYTYTANVNASAGSDVFSYTIKDGDGDTSTATLTLHVNNGVTVTEPAPNVAGHSQVLESGLQPNGTLHDGTSNVASDFITVNAPDGVQTIQIGTKVLSLTDLANLGTTHITVPGADGNLVLTGWNSSTGHLSYTYTLTTNTSGDTTSDSFGVVVTDSNGDHNATSNLVISIVDDVPHAVNDTFASAAPVQQTTMDIGNVLTNDKAGADGPATPHEIVAVTVHSGGNAAEVTATADGSGNYTATLTDGTVHVSSTGEVTFDPKSGYNYGSGDSFTVSYTIKDGDGDQSSATATFGVKGSLITPVNYNDVASVNEPVHGPQNIFIILDISQSMDDVPANQPGGAHLTRLQIAQQAIQNLLTQYVTQDGDSNVKVMVEAFRGTAAIETSDWVNAAAAITAVNNLTTSTIGSSGTDYENAIKTATTLLTTDTANKLAGAPTTVYFMSDGDPTEDGAPTTHNPTTATQSAWATALNLNDANHSVSNVYAVGMGGDVSPTNTALTTVAHPNGETVPAGSVIVVNDFVTLSSTLGATTATPVNGNVLDGSLTSEPGVATHTPDAPGVGTTHLSTFSYTGHDTYTNTITFTWGGVPGANSANEVQVTGAAGGQLIAGDSGNGVVEFKTDYGTMTFYFETVAGHVPGDFTFTPNGVSATEHETFYYETTDSNGHTEADGTISPSGIAGADLVITINNVPQLPVITSGATATEAENTAASHVVYQTTATDPDGHALTYSISGADALLFHIDPNSGAVVFNNAPDFDNPLDSGHDNTYNITVDAHDAVNNNDATQAVAITVTNVDEAPVFTSGTTATEAENTAIANKVYQAAATDPEGKAVTYTLGGTDASLFTLTNGAVTFKSSPDFENPQDSGKDNVYNITLTAKDPAGNSTVQNVAITVTNVNEAPVAVDDTIYTNVATGLQVESAWLLANDTDVDSTLHISAASAATNLTVNATGLPDHVTVDMTGTAAQTHAFGYTVSDGALTDIGAVGVHYVTGATITGSGTTDDIVIGSNANNTLDGGGGNHTDHLFGGSGNDVLVFNTSSTTSTYDGGTGFNTLQIKTDNASVATTSDFASHVHNVDLVDLGTGNSNNVTFGTTGSSGANRLSAQDVLDMTDSSHTLYIAGDAGDTVNLLTGGAGNWTSQGTVNNPNANVPGGQYDHYTATVGTTTVHLYVDADIIQHTGNT